MLTIFSDFTCPYCYVTETALRRVLETRADVAVRYRALELYPSPMKPLSPEEEEGWEEIVRPLALELDLPLEVPGFRPRTRKAHEAVSFARERGVGEQLRDSIFRAYWGEVRDIGRIDVLMELIEPLGVDPLDLKIALDIDLHDRAIADDLELARRLGVPGVPTIYIGTGPDARVLVGLRDRAALDGAIPIA